VGSLPTTVLCGAGQVRKRFERGSLFGVPLRQAVNGRTSNGLLPPPHWNCRSLPYKKGHPSAQRHNGHYGAWLHKSEGPAPTCLLGGSLLDAVGLAIALLRLLAHIAGVQPPAALGTRKSRRADARVLLLKRADARVLPFRRAPAVVMQNNPLGIPDSPLSAQQAGPCTTRKTAAKKKQSSNHLPQAAEKETLNTAHFPWSWLC
jgi:hypothetical protein